jgi:hypothetical protein
MLERSRVSLMNVMCRLCFFGENEGSEKARRMLPCKKCGNKYHRSCLKSWRSNQYILSFVGDLFQIYSTGVHGSAHLVGFVR